MNLSKQERLLLAKLLRLEELLDPDIDRSVEIDALESGYTSFYPEYLSYFENELPFGVVKHVADVLDMYEWLQWALADDNGNLPQDALCRGFDGNDRGYPKRTHAYTVFLIEKAGRFQNVKFKHGKINSNGFEPNYARMLELFESRASRWDERGSDPTLDAAQFARDVIAAG
jgi:uncharacterized protein YfbU (UPF0304 family)